MRRQKEYYVRVLLAEGKIRYLVYSEELRGIAKERFKDFGISPKEYLETKISKEEFDDASGEDVVKLG